MRVDKITKTVEEVRGYYADDGTWFKTEDECRKYEETAKIVVLKMVKDKMIAKTTVYNLLNEGDCDCDVEIFNVDSLETVELLNRYTAINTRENQVEFTADMVGKKIILIWNYDRDWCCCRGSIDDLLAKIKKNYEEVLAQE